MRELKMKFTQKFTIKLFLNSIEIWKPNFKKPNKNGTFTVILATLKIYTYVHINTWLLMQEVNVETWKYLNKGQDYVFILFFFLQNVKE